MNDMMNQTYSQTSAYGESLGRYTAKTFGWMFAGLLFTFAISVALSVSGGILYLLYIPALPYILLIAELGVVFYLSARIEKMSVGTARAMFFVYAALNGVVFFRLFPDLPCDGADGSVFYHGPVLWHYGADRIFWKY